MLHFLDKMMKVGWKWSPQYPEDSGTLESYLEGKRFYFFNDRTTLIKTDFLLLDECDSPGVEEDDYYCDKDLIQLLIFDARVTESFKNPKLSKNSFE